MKQILYIINRAPGEPNNWGHWWRHYEDCTELYVLVHGHWARWNDLNCGAKRSCVCQGITSFYTACDYIKLQ